MPASLATLNAVTKEIYSGKLRKQLNDETTVLKRVERSGANIVTEVGGKYVTFPVHTRRNSGIGARNENEALPNAGQQGTAGARVGLTYQYGAMELSGPAISLADTDYQSFISAVDFESERLRVDLSLDLNRQVYGDGSGALATCIVNTAVNAVVVLDATLFDLDMLVDIVVAVGGAYLTTQGTPRKVTAVNYTTNTVTIDGAPVTTAVTHIFVRAGNYNREWTGLKAIVATTGVLFNIDPAAEPVWTANVDSNGGTLRALSESIMNTMSDTIKQRGGKTTAAFTTYGLRRAYANLLQQQRTYVNTEGKFDGGYKQLAYATPDGDVPMVVDRMGPKNKMWFVNEEALTLYREHDWDFMTYANGDKWRLKSNASGDFDAYIARMNQYSQLGTDRRNSHGLIADLSEA